MKRLLPLLVMVGALSTPLAHPAAQTTAANPKVVALELDQGELYTAQGVAPTGWHTLEVRVKQRRANVTARPGYLSGK